MKEVIALGASLLVGLFCWAQGEIVIPDNAIYQESIRTIVPHHVGNELSPPFFELGVGGMTVRFDDLGQDFRDLYYTVYLCSSDWEFSELDQSEYINGFSENYINQYEQSFNTFVDFSHYVIDFPNDMSSVNRSGNYVLVVYEDGDAESALFSCRFVVYENLVLVDGKVNVPTEVSQRSYGQEVDFKIKHPSYDIRNPYSDFQVSILQNNRWDNAIADLEPRFVKDRELDYDYGKENNFEGGNEWRGFDLKQVDFITPQIARTELVGRQWNCWLKPDPKRAYLQYKTIGDINGRYLVKNDDGFDRHLEADYVLVHFTLPFDFPLANSKIYVYGALSNWGFDPAYELHYDYDRKEYRASIMLKQGYYNYTYRVVAEEDYFTTSKDVEGTHFVTENDYTIFAYNYDYAGDYDRVVGVLFLNSRD